MSIPEAPAAERNKAPILDALRPRLESCREVLEIGSGTGVHAAWFTQVLPELVWQPSNPPGNNDAMRERVRQVGSSQIKSPVDLDLLTGPWPDRAFDMLYAANVVHIAPFEATPALFAGANQVLTETGVVCLYGPYFYTGETPGEGNAAFDASLRSEDPRMGIRLFEDVAHAALEHGLELEEDMAMPANNRLLVFRRVSGV